jgi:hypothetical protein
MEARDPRVLAFYARNPHVDFDAMNVLLVGMLERLGGDLGLPKVVQELGDMRQELRRAQDGWAEANRAFVDTVKLLFSVHGAESADRTAALLDRHTQTFVDRLQAALPHANSRLEEQLRTLQAALQAELQRALGANGAGLETLERRVAALQQPLVALVQAGADGTQQRVAGLADEVRGARAAQERLYGELSGFLQKYNASPQFKGRHSEDQLSALLCDLFPTAEVQNTTGVTASGDFMVVRGGGKPRVLVENKNYQRNVEQVEVDKFLRDCAAQRCSGVMVSQFSGIVSKPNFFLEVNDGNVLVYLHHGNYSKDQLRLAFDVVDHLAGRLGEGGAEGGTVVPKATLDALNGELQTFVRRKEALAATVRDSHRALLAQLDELHLPALLRLLGGAYTSPQAQTYACPTCAAAFASPRGLAAHKKVHGAPKKK